MAAKIDRLGETRIMNCGMEATIIRYGRYDDIDVRFEDGTVVENGRYGNFKKGKIAHSNTKDRLGETRMMNCGMKATIIRYGGYNDIDVRFEDGKVVVHKAYRAFKRGEIANPNIRAFVKDRLGETRMMNCGMKATIIRYGGCNDIDIRFEDGKVVVHKKYDQFKKGEIANPNVNSFAEARLGEIRMMNCGMKATIIRYGKHTDIDIRFEDGTVVKNRRYGEFKIGTIVNHNINPRLGETRMMNCGMKATIIRYGKHTDIDIRFEDGSIIEHKQYSHFKKGSIVNPNFNPRLGETSMMNCGMEATIIRYGKSIDIDVRFEDGAVVEHKGYSALKNGKISHPSINRSHGSKDFHGFICKQGFKDEDRVLYECICKHCGLEDVLTPQEMIEHEKLEHGGNK